MTHDVTESSEAKEKPFWQQGNYLPVHEEATLFDLPAEGSIPPSLCGLYARNGANPRNGRAGHWFFGDGMVHGVSIREGKAEWYRNRWVRTPLFDAEAQNGKPVPELKKSVANTSVVSHAGRIFALVENALPMEITRELGTAGFYDFDGKLNTPFTAHPKICPVTGELHFFGYSWRPPFLTYHVADAAGRLTRSMEIPVAASTMMHDFALTSGSVIFMDLPVVLDLAAAKRGTMPFSWSDTYGARLGVLPRGAGIEALRWVEIEPCYVFHVANAFEEADGTIVIDVAWYRHLWRGGPSGTAVESATMRRWRIKPGASKAAEERIDDRPVEFPRVNDSRAGLPHSVIYTAGTGGDFAAGRYNCLIKYNIQSGTDTVKEFKDGLPGEFAFIPDGPNAGEDEGWLIGFVYDWSRNASDLMILDAQNVGGKPVARIMLPRRVPQGFHGNWLPYAELERRRKP